MKKILTILVALFMVFGLVGCSSSDSNSDNSDSSADSETIKIGTIYAMSGGNAAIGENILRGCLLFCR